jgi:hypothetical protein
MTPMLAAMLLAAMNATAFPAPATYRYTGSMGGEKIGSWAISVTQNDAMGPVLAETSSASIFGMPLSATASLILGPDFAPTKYDGSYKTPNENPTVSVALTPTSATVVSTLANQPRQIALGANTHHFVVIEPGLMAGLFALPAQLGAWKDSSVTWITPTTAQAESLTTTPSTPPRPAGIAAQDAAIAIDAPIAVTIWYDPNTLVPDEIIVPSQNAVLTRVRS